MEFNLSIFDKVEIREKKKNLARHNLTEGLCHEEIIDSSIFARILISNNNNKSEVTPLEFLNISRLFLYYAKTPLICHFHVNG